jgi:hypothetical protein
MNFNKISRSDPELLHRLVVNADFAMPNISLPSVSNSQRNFSTTHSLIPVLEEAGCDHRTWTITVRLRELIDRPRLRWETVHKYLEQMVEEQMIFRYEDPSGIVTYSKNSVVREKVLF